MSPDRETVRLPELVIPRRAFALIVAAAPTNDLARGLVRLLMRLHFPSRPAAIRVGEVVAAVSSQAYQLPKGIGAGTKVEVLFIAPPGPDNHVVVRDPRGCEWKLRHWYLSAGSEYEIATGLWLHESHPVVLDYLERELARAQRRPAVRGSEIQREEYLERLRTLLRSYGRSG